MQTVQLKNAPDVKRAITAAFPGYRKTSAFLSVMGDHGVTVNSYWDGGSRAEYALVDLATGQRKPLPRASHPYFDIARAGFCGSETEAIAVDHVGNVTLKFLPEGIALVQAGTFCGKAATAHVFVNAANMAKLLTGGGR